MKKWYSAILLCLLFTAAHSQDYYNQAESEAIKEVTYPEMDYIGWKIEREGYWGSFWWKVTRQKQGVNYYYTVYVFSNSYFNQLDQQRNYKKAITKISGCIVWAEDFEEAVDFEVGTVVFDWKESYLFQFYTTDPNARVKIKYSEVHPYDYSRLK